MPIRKAVRNRLPRLSSLGLVIALTSGPAADAAELVRIAQVEAEPAETEPAEEPAPGPPGAGVEEIIVRGAESAAAQDFKVADSVTAFSTADLVALGAANIADLAAFTPNLEIVTAGATAPTFFIRGVGLNDFNPNSTGAVAVYQDDVPINAPPLQLASLFDMENVSVLRGPQGTGLARNASAGAIKLYARRPTGQFNGFLRGEFGNYDHRLYEGAIEAPMYEDVLAGRFAFIVTDRDGTMRNRCGSAPPNENRVSNTGPITNQPPFSICGEPVFIGAGNPGGKSLIPIGLHDTLNDRDNWAARGTLLFEPTLDMSWTLGAHGARRNELSRVGQSYGVNGTQCLFGKLLGCTEGADPTNLSTGGTQITRLLGGQQGSANGYQAPEVAAAWTAIAPCYDFGKGFCGVAASNPNFRLLDLAKRTVARQLARNLDEEPWKGDFNHTGRTKNDTWGVSARSEFVLPWDLELFTTTGYDTYDRSLGLDLDFSPETLFHIFTKDEGWQAYQDVKLAGEHELISDSPFRWEIGGYALREQLDVNVVNDLGAAGSFAVGEREYTQKLWSAGGFGTFSSDFWDDFTLDGGVRYNWEQKEIDYLLKESQGTVVTPLAEYDVFQEPTGTLRLTYRFREDTHAYWKYTRGWKPGHYNATGSRLQGITIARPEVIDAFETGLRAEWFGGMLSGEASLFYYNYQDYQIFTAQQFAGGGPEFVVINANDAEVYGAEIDAVLRPWAGGFVNVRFGWLETQFLDFVLIQQGEGPCSSCFINFEIQNSGNPLLNSPNFKVSVTAEQAIPLGNYGYLVPRYDGAWTDDTYYDATKGRGIPHNQHNQQINFLPKLTIGQRAYWLHNAGLAYRTPDGRLEIAGFVRNIENKATKTFAFDGSTFQRTTIYYVNDPRTYGGRITVTF